jgi:hypothetical protein
MHAYITRSGQFARPGPARGQSDDGWWRRLFADGTLAGDAMVEMVERLHSIPPHTAAVERFYSRLGFMQRPHRSHLSVKMLANMAMANAWLVATDPQFGKPRRAASKRIAAHASSDGQGRASTNNKSGDSDDDEDNDAVPCGDDGLADADADDEAMTAANSDNESLLRAESAGVAPAAPERPTSKERLAARVSESPFLLAMDTCDLTSPFLLAGIHGTSVVQEAPTEESPGTSSESEDAVKTAKAHQRIKRFF